MKNVLRSKVVWGAALIISIVIVGCNIFNPTESIDIKNSDAKALTYEGYLKFRNNEYTEAEEYFNRAIAADSSHSEAWYGLMKAMLNRKLNTGSDSTNLFTLLTYVNSSRNSRVPFAGMSENIASVIKSAVDSVDLIASTFIERDKNGRCDGVITYKTIADGYMVLQMMKTMLVLRKTTSTMENCSLDKNSDNACNMGAVLNSLKDNPEETIESFHAVFSTCEESPESMANYFESYLQGFENIKPEAQQSAISSMCGALAEETDESKTSDGQQSKTLNIIIGQLGYSDIMDDDGDGCIDEEVYDGEDNDGDGEIDEDVRDKSGEIKYDNDAILKNVMAGHKEIKDLRVVKSAAPNEKYLYVDIDMNGTTPSMDAFEITWEWGFFYPDYANRVATGDHRFNFATQLEWNKTGLAYENFKYLKQLIAKDTDPNNIQYSLEYRKKYIGGCWNNYNEAKFQKWFEGRNKQ